jgi:hypothetical protein
MSGTGRTEIARRLVREFVRDPACGVDRIRLRIRSRHRERRGPPSPVATVPAGAASPVLDALADVLEAPRPAMEGFAEEFREVWEGFRLDGRDLAWARDAHDADRILGLASWVIVRWSSPEVVVETGVARGVTSRIVLEALSVQGTGHLYSIDLPPLQDPWYGRSREAVPDKNHPRWTYVKGDARRVLPRVLRGNVQPDVFIHDSLHTDDHMAWEFRQAWNARPAKGAYLLADDIDMNGAFDAFVAATRSRFAVISHENKSGSIGVAALTKR